MLNQIKIFLYKKNSINTIINNKCKACLTDFLLELVNHLTVCRVANVCVHDFTGGMY